MKFQEFWIQLSRKLPRCRKFRTLSRSKPFEAYLLDGNTIKVIPGSTKEPRPVKMTEFQKMWDIMKGDIRSERYKNRKKRYYPFWNQAYVSALIDYVVADQNME